MADEIRRGKELGMEQRPRDDDGKGKLEKKEGGKRIYMKEATVTVDLGNV